MGKSRGKRKKLGKVATILLNKRKDVYLPNKKMENR